MSRYGLVVGVAKYKSPLSNLSKTEGDAKAVADLLRQYGDFQDLQVLTGEVTKEKLEEALTQLLQDRADRHEALIYYTGHAVVVKGSFGKKRGYFAVSNTVLKTSNSEIASIDHGIALDDLSSLIGNANLSNLVLLLDCCHSETLLEECQAWIQKGTITQALTDLKKDYFLVSACRKFEEAYAVRSEAHSIFTGALLQGLAREQANDRGVVNASKMYGYIADRLRGTGQEAVDLGFGGGSIRVVDYRSVVTETPIDDICPYVGLEAFTKETARFFKGREQFVKLLYQKLAESSFVPVIGASGSGKSSLVRAGLIPELEAQGNWLILPPIKPGDSPLVPINEISRVLTQICQRAATKPKISQAIAAGNLEVAIAHLPEPQKLLLVVDQFEEIFTVCPAAQEAERQQFIDLLVGITQYPESCLRVVMTMRADFFENCLNYRGLGEVIQQHHVLLLPMTEEELKEAIALPAQVGQYDLGEGLLPAILRDIRNEKNILPLLEFALTQLWERRENRRLTLAAYDALGGVMGALDRHADGIYNILNPQEQELAKRICLKLVRTGQGERDTRQRQPKQELLQLVGESQREILENVLEELVQGRLLTTDREKTAWVDLCHEALMDEWRQFAIWRQENRDLRRLVERVEDNYREWLAKEKNEHYFLPNGLLLEVREHRQSVAELLSVPAWDYYQQSEQNATDKIAFIERNLTEIKLREEAMQVLRLLPYRRVEDSLTAIRAAGESQDKLNTMLNPLQANLQVAMLQVPIANILPGHQQATSSVAFSPDGKYIVSGSADKTIRLWDLQGNQIGSPFQGHQQAVSSVAFSPDGKYIVSGSADKTIRLWDLQGNQIGSPFQGHQDFVSSIAFSPDGKCIVSGSVDKTLRLWDLQGNQIGSPFQGHQSSIRSVAFSPDGKCIASGSADHTLRLWDLQGNQIGSPFQGHQSSVWSVAFSPDGKYIVSGSADYTLRLWDLQSDQISSPFRGHQFSVWSVAFSPDGKYIVSGGKDNTLRLWDLQGNQISSPFRGHQSSVWSVVFSPDGKYIVSGSLDNTLRLWDLQGNQIGSPFQGHQSSIRSVAFSPNGKYIVSSSDDHTLRLWDLQGNQIGSPFQGHQQAVRSVAFSPDGKYIVSGSDDNTLCLWNLQGNQIGSPFQGHQQAVSSVAFSPDGKYIVSGSADKTLRLWGLQGNQIGSPFQGHQDSVLSVAFSPNGRFIVSGSDDKTLRLWHGGWRAWLEVCCNRLRYHPVFKNPTSDLEREACEVCRKYVWSKETEASEHS